MAKCNLSIELAEENESFWGGQSVRGTVVVHTDADVQCKGLEVKTAWRTHGYGNVATGAGQTLTVFQGQWVAGQTYRYDFELITAPWPPTYHGHYLNVDHAIEARAYIPWSFDPKTSRMIQVWPTGGPDDVLVGQAAQAANGGVGLKIFGSVFFLIFAIVILANPFAWILAIPIGMLVGVWWLVFRFLPRARLGEVEYRLDTPRLAPGQELLAELVIHPKRNVQLNRILWKVSGTEICVSGSGSNRSTRRHEVFANELQAAGETTLPAGQVTRIPLRIQLPETTAYSLDLSDNRLSWTTDLVVDIPHWPDWKANAGFQLLPPVALGEGSAPPLPEAAVIEPTAGSPPATMPPPADSGGAGVTFDETVRHIWAARGDEEQRELLITAVEDIPFEIQAVIERRLLYGNDDPAAYRDGYVVWAHYPDPELPLTLYAPHHLADDFEQANRDVWKGRGRISGYDRRHGRLKIHLDELSQ
ncbi:vacuolar protein sorting-associated family 26 protein [Roseimaritima ulvae]|uniref:hypothetical protein n=1 Tax=Roseimaritima ulvae TaxID=980254 RepID=UPI00083258FD|nr:hypothetical protein [Roseimaritima ulvae]